MYILISLGSFIHVTVGHMPLRDPGAHLPYPCGIGNGVKLVHGAVSWACRALLVRNPSLTLPLYFLLHPLLMFPTWRTVPGVSANHITIPVLLLARLPRRRYDRLLSRAFSYFEGFLVPIGCYWDYSALPVWYTAFPVRIWGLTAITHLS